MELRPATLDDATFVADVQTLVHPSEPQDPVVERYDWDHEPQNWRAGRFVVTRDGRQIGWADLHHPDWNAAPSRFALIGAEVLPEVRDPATLAELFVEMEGRATAAGARLVAARSRDDDPVRISALELRGFHEDRRGKKWELDLVAGRERLLAMTAQSRTRMAAEGIQLLTLAEDADPDRYQRIWRLNEQASGDVPSTLGNVEETLEDTMTWLRAPNMREDRFWVARDGDEIVGVSVLEYPPVRGVVNTAWTATARAARGRGIARALKCETVAQAIELGVDRVRTGNDAKNDPILHLNQTMGYDLFLTRITFHKDL